MRKNTLLPLLLLVLLSLVACEEGGMTNPPSQPARHWSEINPDSDDARERYGDEDDTIEEARSFFRDPIGWAQDLGSPQSQYRDCSNEGPKLEDSTEGDRELGTALTDKEKEMILDKVGARPGFSRAVNTPIDRIRFGSDEMKEKGYYQYYPSGNARRQDRRFGTERTVWRVEAAAQILKEKGIYMAVGDISKQGGRGTGGHKSHQKGVDVDLRLVAPDGMGTACAHYSQSCSSSEKTAEMIKAMIAVDPTNVRKVFINDPAVIAEVNEYSRSLGIGDVAGTCPGHNNHVHVSYKN
jgi:hypothetical protein